MVTNRRGRVLRDETGQRTFMRNRNRRYLGEVPLVIPVSSRFSSSVNRKEAACTFSSRCSIEEVPGIGSMMGDRLSSQASATCAFAYWNPFSCLICSQFTRLECVRRTLSCATCRDIARKCGSDEVSKFNAKTPRRKAATILVANALTDLH